MTAPANPKGEVLALAERVDALSGPDREVDAAIAPHQGFRVVDEGHPLGRCCYDGMHRLVVLPRYTASLDAAMALVPTWLSPTIIGHAREVRLFNGVGLPLNGTDCGSRAATLPLALTAAALRARATAIREKD